MTAHFGKLDHSPHVPKTNLWSKSVLFLAATVPWRIRMRRSGAWVFLAILFPLHAFALNPPQALNPDSFYRLGPDSLEQEGVPKGQIRGPFTLPSAVFPGTQHTYWVYVPAQYGPSTPASLMIFNDGQAFMAPAGNLRAFNVLDNLIYRREIPVM